MENENLNQYKNQENRIDVKISVSRDGKWIIIRIPGMTQTVIKSVNYFKKILESAEKRQLNSSVSMEKVKG